MTLENDLYSNAASYGRMSKGKFVAAASSQVLDSTNEDVARQKKSIGDVAAMLKGSFPNGSPPLGQFVVIA